MSVIAARKVDELLSDGDFRTEFFVKSKEAVAKVLRDLAEMHDCSITDDEAYVLSSVFSDGEQNSWLSEGSFASLLQHGKHRVEGELLAHLGPQHPCNPSTLRDESYGPPGEGPSPCNPSTPGDEPYGPGPAPCNPSTPGD